MATMTPAQVSTLDPWQLQMLLDASERPWTVSGDIEGGWPVYTVWRAGTKIATFYSKHEAYLFANYMKDSTALAETTLAGEPELAEGRAYDVLALSRHLGVQA